MKKICLVQGGKFLLGIAAEDILARTSWAEAGTRLGSSAKAVHLGALLSRQPGGAPPPDAVCLELPGFVLIVDQVAADGAELINPPGPLPPACPRLAARLCPQVTIWGDMPVLLLDPAQVIPVAEELGGDIGMVAVLSPKKEPASEPEACPTEADDGGMPEPVRPHPAAAAEAAPPEIDCAAEVVDEELSVRSAPAVEGLRACPSEQEEAPPPSPEQQRKDAAAIDEETFLKVMSWTVSRFKQRKAGEKLSLGIDQLPPELAALICQKGLSKSIVQYLIDQIVLRCQESAGRRTTGGKHAN